MASPFRRNNLTYLDEPADHLLRPASRTYNPGGFKAGFLAGGPSDATAIHSPQVSQKLIDWRGIFSLMDSPHNDTELHQWLRWVFESRKPPYFVCTVAEAAVGACMPDYLLLRPVLLELKRQHPEPEPGPAALDDPELRDRLHWASKGGNVPSFVGRVVEAAIYACSPDYALLRPVVVELKLRYPEG